MAFFFGLGFWRKLSSTFLSFHFFFSHPSRFDLYSTPALFLFLLFNSIPPHI